MNLNRAYPLNNLTGKANIQTSKPRSRRLAPVHLIKRISMRPVIFAPNQNQDDSPETTREQLLKS